MLRNRGVIRSYILAWVSAGRMPGVDAPGTPGATWPWGTMLSVVSAEADAGKAAAREIAAARRARLWDTRARALDTLSNLRRAVQTSANVPSLRHVTASLRQKQDVTPDLTECPAPPAPARAAPPEAERFRAASAAPRAAIWHSFVRLLHDDELAQDLTSEVFLVAWRRRGEA